MCLGFEPHVLLIRWNEYIAVVFVTRVQVLTVHENATADASQQ